ncbi:MAG TPA: histidine--tRNA ligase [Kofleriaceae bacterium]|jgi:histidyl-tRNA synthetase
MPVQPRTPQGVLELLPAQQIAFQRMLDTIRRGFERFGFLPVETPAFELTDILLTKSGGETEKQVYFVQSTGALEAGKKPELALRFDLTVPLARYVAEHEHELNFPFRRYQIQRVYRGERAQKGRYREFYQCDVDVIGKDSLSIAYDSELPALIHGVFSELAFGGFTIFVNNRKLLRGLLESLGIEQQAEVLHEIDRLRKIGRAEVETRIAAIAGDAPAKALLDTLTRAWPEVAGELRAKGNAVLTEGVDELERVHTGTLALGVPASQIKVDLSIVRGLDYYTGTVYETFLDDHPDYGSICSGGRYENLAGHYTKSKLPGVGISIGVTRLLSQMLEADKGSPVKRSIAEVCVTSFDPALAADYAAIARELRGAGVNVDVYGAADKPGKQLKYVDRAGIPLAIIVGGREASAGVVKLKDMRAAESVEHDVPRGQLVAKVRELLGRT